MILKHFPKIVAAVCKKAEGGDMRAAKLIMDRIIPVRRAIDDGSPKGQGGITIVVQGTDTKIGAMSRSRSQVIEVTENARQEQTDQNESD